MPSKIFVGVYGTLKKNGSNHELLSGSDYLGVGETPPNYTLLEMGCYPGAIYGQSKLLVEVFEINEKTLLRLDQLEGHPSFYERLLIPILMDDGYVIDAWVYTIGHLGSNYSNRPRFTTFDHKGRLDWSYKQNESIW